PAYQDTPHMGGNYNSNFCLGEQKMPTSGATALGSIVSAGSLTGSAKYTAPANTRIDGGTIPANTNAAIYVNGDVYISGANGGISYSNAGWNWSTTNDTVPSFAVVAVGGNIYIDRNVTNLDGLYVAQKAGGNGGKIYDCTNGIGTANVVGVGSMFSDCNNQLVVHGNLVADQINLMRTLGSLRDSLKNPGETPRGPIGRTCSDGGVYKVCAGEVFDFSPELYLGKLQLTQSNNGATVYQAYTSLPPIL
ncbi:MAG TPA: hypothetical protein VN778_02320, partial [Verrucomicrobiae bacterium]|nr:hypothetical protein [Verrucomicrobiae bacterium]